MLFAIMVTIIWRLMIQLETPPAAVSIPTGVISVGTSLPASPTDGQEAYFG